MAANCFKLGSYGWIIKTAAATPFRIGSAPIDLTTYSSVEAHLHPPNGLASKAITVGVVGSVDGEVTYTVGNGDFDRTGVWRVVFWIDDGAGIRVNSCDYEMAISKA